LKSGADLKEVLERNPQANLVMSGAELEEWISISETQKEWYEAVMDRTRVFARVSPIQKAQIAE